NDSALVHLQLLALPLLPGITYTSIVSSALTDLAGNHWISSGESNFTFTTAAILNVSPTNGTSVVAGQPFTVDVTYDQGLGADAFQFTLDTKPPVTLAAAPDVTHVEVALRMPTNVPSARLSIAALHTGSSPYVLPDITLNARAAGVNHSPIAGNGQSSGALLFDGIDDFVETGNWSPGSQWSLEAWVRPTSAPSGRRTIVGGANECRDWALTLQDGVFGLVVRQPGGCSETIASGIRPVLGQWYHLAGTSDGTNASLYVNGVLKAFRPVDPNYIGTVNSARIGSETCCGGDSFPGTIEEARVWNVPLTADQVHANMERRISPSEPGLISHWQFDEQSGLLAADSSGSGHDGTLGSGNAANSPLWVSGIESFTNVAITGSVPQVTLTLGGSDADADVLATTLTTLPARGRVYQTLDGTTLRTLITNVPTVVSNLSGRVVYVPPNVNDTMVLTYKVSDGLADSGDAVVVLDLNVLPVATNIGPGEIVYSRLGSPDGVIYVAAADGSNERQITIGEQPKLSLDGRYVAFHRDNANYGKANLYVRDLLTGNENLLVTDTDFIISYGWRADSSRLVYDMVCSIYDNGRDGSGQFTLSSVNCYDDAPAVNWIDGRVAFHNTQPGGDIGLLTTNGTARTIIAGTQPGDVWPAWSADGEWISFLDGTNVFKIRPDGTGLLQLTSLTGSNRFLPPGAWAADGTQIIIAGYVNGTNGLFAISTDGSGFSLLRASTGGADYDYVG